ncbi:hypothetical protein BKM31_17530 [[Actinomadura] parvosata subsp. kistnae]|uniref:HTH cro/C1-type domain-containing protein n=1 Tax=[Actinomadura] parvosata subsp. kistnae TaxID=1909395 RepID=A0A1U9ZYJ4_9ACTN|nr:helix-turn-helix transcriptional regulator [Nonomuraea sp. ATCC 55076]AQZ63022.1 hypothetical protein BKM31_17530 [Nonomuraea sp. ATCC 55076]
MYDETTIGARLRILRKWRGMTLEQLGGQADLSVSFLSMAERGLRALDRRSHIAALAAALRVSETDLVGGPHLTADTEQSDPHSVIPGLRIAVLTPITRPNIEQARPVSVLASEMTNTIEPLHKACKYSAEGRILPDLIEELTVHAAAPADEATHRLALSTLVEAYHRTAAIARALNYHDLALLAASKAEQAAEILDDPVARGKAAFTAVQNGPKTGTVSGLSAWDRAYTSVRRAIDEMSPYISRPDGIEVLGMLALNAALCAAALNDGQGAQEWLGHAAELATQAPDDPVGNWGAFSATNVAIWRVGVNVELGEGGNRVLELGRTVQVAKLDTYRARKSAFFAEMGRGLARESKTRQSALTWLRQAEALAPQRVRNDMKVRESVAVMLEQVKTAAVGRELRGMAARLGIPH